MVDITTALIGRINGSIRCVTFSWFAYDAAIALYHRYSTAVGKM